MSQKSLGLPFHPSLCLLFFASSKTVVMAVLDTLKYVQNQVLFKTRHLVHVIIRCITKHIIYQNR